MSLSSLHRLNCWGERKAKMNDSVIEQIRETRHQISAEHTHDPEKLVAYYIELQKRYRDRLVEPSQIEETDAESINA